jgi:RNA polymerase sigma factor (sigma-70 family)
MAVTNDMRSTSQSRVSRADEDLVRLYLNDIGRYPMLTKQDEVRLAQAIENGNAARQRLATERPLKADQTRALRRAVRNGEDARATFVQSNLRLVVSIAKKYQGSGQPLLDLIQEGNLGLIHAVEKFDWRPGFKFSTYATWWIRQAITRGVVNTGRMIRLPARVADRLSQVQRARWYLEFKLHRPATVSEIAAEIDMEERKVAEVLRYATEPKSLSEPLREGSDNELGDFIEDHDVAAPFDTALVEMSVSHVATLLGMLDERERRIISLRFGFDRGEPRTLKEVGSHFDVTHERIRQIEARAMSKMRRCATRADARSLLDA